MGRYTGRPVVPPEGMSCSSKASAATIRKVRDAAPRLSARQVSFRRGRCRRSVKACAKAEGQRFYGVWKSSSAAISPKPPAPRVTPCESFDDAVERRLDNVVSSWVGPLRAPKPASS